MAVRKMARVTLFALVLLWLGPQASDDADFRRTLEARFSSPSFAPVREAERVDVLPIESEGEGLSSTYRVQERPVTLHPSAARELRQAILKPESYRGGPMACMFQPGLALRFHKGGEWVQALVCFSCDELIFEHQGQEANWQDKLTFDATLRRRMLEIAKKTLPARQPVPAERHRRDSVAESGYERPRLRDRGLNGRQAQG
jgi:hypothetical protein